MKFASYRLDRELVQALKEEGYTDLTPIQEATLAKILNGKSLICKSQTGSGKTHAFLVPLMNGVDPEKNAIQALIVSPTSILAEQTYEFAKNLARRYPTVSVKLVSPRQDKSRLLDELAYGKTMPKMLIGTPDQLVDLFIEKKVDSTGIRVMVLDEADMLLDDSHRESIERLLAKIRPAQRLVFTATMKEHQVAETYRFVGADEIVDVDKKARVNRNVAHHLVDIKHRDPIEQIVAFIEKIGPYRLMIFASEKTRVERIYRELAERGLDCTIINGNLRSRENKNNLRRIHRGEFPIIVCSDIASRGIDIDDVSHVLSVDLPKDFDYYFHRAGRTGRNGKKGDSYVFFNDDDDTFERFRRAGIDFDTYVLRKDALRKASEPSAKRKKNEALESEIRREIAKVRTRKVKPGYKKKIAKTVAKVKSDHKRKIIRSNLRAKKAK